MDNLAKKDQPDRSNINIHVDYEVKFWTKELGVTREQLQKAIDKVGDSASAVRKDLTGLGSLLGGNLILRRVARRPCGTRRRARRRS